MRKLPHDDKLLFKVSTSEQKFVWFDILIENNVKKIKPPWKVSSDTLSNAPNKRLNLKII